MYYLRRNNWKEHGFWFQDFRECKVKVTNMV